MINPSPLDNWELFVEMALRRVECNRIELFLCKFGYVNFPPYGRVRTVVLRTDAKLEIYYTPCGGTGKHDLRAILSDNHRMSLMTAIRRQETEKETRQISKENRNDTFNLLFNDNIN